MPHKHLFVALYDGRTIGTAHVVAASADPLLARFVAAKLLNRPIHDAIGVGADLTRKARAKGSYRDADGGAK
jgi:hypothetical protein